ncbi:helix-turn-helix domain-containing protein [Nocardiopsis sp. NPDC049922]|uniref:TetR/AcrR family transcriptional regulator n=1 Tax=Nocardiopsis sp. NPDC049922 TaxID=3155157 RepID=UPI0033DE99B7
MRSEDAAPRVGRPPRVTRDDIIEAVLELGFDAATVTAVARRLRVDPSTLYGHVPGREAMLNAAAETAIARAPWPEPTGSWRDYVRACAEVMWVLFDAHPGLARRLRTMASLPPSLAAVSLRITRHLVTMLDIDVHFAALIVDTVGDMMIDSHITAIALNEPVAGTARGLTGRERSQHLLDTAVGIDDPFVAEYTRVIHEAMGEPGRPSGWWREKLALVLDGIEHRLGR